MNGTEKNIKEINQNNTVNIQWKKLGMEDETIIKSYYNQIPIRNCEFTFANNLLWAPFYEIR